MCGTQEPAILRAQIYVKQYNKTKLRLLSSYVKTRS